MRKLNIILFIVLFALLIYAALNIVPSGNSVEAVNAEDEDLPLPFKKGERLIYDLKYKMVKIGKSVLTFQGEEVLGNKEVYHITFFTKIPGLKDIEELYAEKNTFLPLEVHRTIKKAMLFTERIREEYAPEDFRVDIEKKSFFSKTFSIKKDSPIHNAILLIYYYRTREDFNQNEKSKVNLPTAEFELTFKGIETIKTPLGKYRAYAFSSYPSKFKFWLSADSKRIPLKIENPSLMGYSLVIKSIE